MRFVIRVSINTLWIIIMMTKVRIGIIHYFLEEFGSGEMGNISDK